MKMITLLICFLSVTITRSAPVSNHLYFPGEGVELLDTDNFTQTVENSSTAWLVEFYASWCGDCQRFVPIWKKLASDVQQWSDMLKVGVLACSDEINTNICRKYQITRYPTVKYFHENYQTTDKNLGKDVVHDEEITVDELKKKVIERLVKETREGRGKMYPNIQPYTDSHLGKLFDGECDEIQFVFLVVENDDSYLGLELAMDLHKNPSIAVRYAPSNSPLVQNLHIDRFPHILVFDRANNSQRVSNSKSKRHIRTKIEKFLRTKGIKLIEDDVKELSSGGTVNQDPSIKFLRDYIKKMGDVIFQVDLETALRYSLKTEISAVKTIKNKQLQALNDYFSVIKDYFPFGYNNSDFINKFVNFTTTASEIEGSQIEALLKQAEDNRVFSSPQKFLGCLGSSPRYKGYPCSLWRLFHYLTVNFAITNANNTNVNPRKVLNAIHGYVKYFFSCKYCSQHFQQMVADRNMKNVSSLPEQVLWLWEAHNVVNKRLKGDVTEDPEYPKDQFPSSEKCPECYDKEGWNTSEVLKYLEKMYQKYNVRYIGSDTTVLFPGLD